jgi:hypothetical protein
MTDPEAISRHYSHSRTDFGAADLGAVILSALTGGRQGHRARIKVSGAPLALGLHIVLGQDGPTMLKNMARNYEEGRVGLIQGVAVRAE